jgi:hypothetical protein
VVTPWHRGSTVRGGRKSIREDGRCVPIKPIPTGETALEATSPVPDGDDYLMGRCVKQDRRGQGGASWIGSPKHTWACPISKGGYGRAECRFGAGRDLLRPPSRRFDAP